MVQKLKDLRVYCRVERYWSEVYQLCARPAFRRDRALREQIESANDSVKANISEGFEQGSDAQFVRYLHYAKGSLAEVLSRLGDAEQKGYIAEDELRRFAGEAERILNGLGKLIQYLDECNWKDRGRHHARLRAADRKDAAGSKDTGRKPLPETPSAAPWLPNEDAPADPATSD